MPPECRQLYCQKECRPGILLIHTFSPVSHLFKYNCSFDDVIQFMLLLKLTDQMFRPRQNSYRFPSIIFFKRKVTSPDEELRTILRHPFVFHFRLCVRSWLSGNLGKTALRLTEIIRMYFDTSLKTSRRDYSGLSGPGWAVHRKGILFSSPLIFFSSERGDGDKKTGDRPLRGH